MNGKTQKKKHIGLIILAIVLAVPAIAALFLMTHTQIIVGAIQKLSAGTVNTINSYEPLGEPMEGIKDNGLGISLSSFGYVISRKLFG